MGLLLNPEQELTDRQRAALDEQLRAEPDVDVEGREEYRKLMRWREFGWKPGEQVRRVSGDVVFEGEVADRDGYPGVRITTVVIRGERVTDHSLVGEVISADPEHRWSSSLVDLVEPRQPEPTRVETTADGREVVTRRPRYIEGKTAALEYAPGRGGRKRGRVTKWGVRIKPELVEQALEARRRWRLPLPGPLQPAEEPVPALQAHGAVHGRGNAGASSARRW